MEEYEIKDIIEVYLQNNLTINVRSASLYEPSNDVVVELKLKGEVISYDYISIPWDGGI